MNQSPTNTQTSLAVSIRTMGQDLAAIQKGQTPLPRVETVSAGPPEALPVEQLLQSPRPPAARPITPPAQLESVLAPKTLILQRPPAPLPPLPKPALPHPAQWGMPKPPAPPTPVVTATPPAVSSILEAKIQTDLQNAVKRQDALVTSVLRLLLAAIHNAEIATHKEPAGLDDNEIQAVIAAEVRRRKEAIEGYGRGGRGELVEKERTELAVLYHYLPTTLVPLAGPKPPTPPKPAAPPAQPVKPAFSLPSQPPHPTIPPPPAAAPKPATPPVAPPTPKPPTAPQQAQPPAQKPEIPAVPARPQPAAPRAPAAGTNRRRLVLATSAIAVIVLAAAGGAVWWFKFRPTPAPPPPPVVAPTPLLLLPTQTIEVDDPTKIPNAVSNAWTATGTPGNAQIVFVKIVRPGAEKVRPHYASASQILTAYQLTVPEPIVSSVTDLNLFRHTQSEILSPFAGGEDPNRFGLILELETSGGMTASLRSWESTMESNLRPYLRTDRFALRPGPEGEPFEHQPREPIWYDSTYRGILIRYMNIDLADQSIDYVHLSQRSLLLIATSRESMYALIDAVLIQNRW